MLSKFYKSKSSLLLTFMMLASFAAMAQPKAPSTLSNPLAQVLVLIMILLLLAIAILGNVVNSATSIFREKIRKEREAAKAAEGSGNSALAIVLLLVSGMLLSASVTAQDAAAAAAPAVETTFNGLSAFTFYLLVSVIAVEILILIALVYQLKFLVGIESKRVLKAAVETKPREGWWWRINKAASVEEEKDIDLSHDYDGISELDNKLPPWWIAAFAVTIVFAGVYLWRYHVVHSAPLPLEELEITMKQAEAEKAAYLSKSASNVDESTVKLLDAAGIAAGKALYTTNCTPCHGTNGEGNTVGPNLTDKYWIHGGAISDVFKSIKYGWVEKGMRSWKDDFSPLQIAQIASFVKSIGGSNPPNAKEPQGEPYEEGAGTAAPVTDSTGATPAAK